MKTLIEPHKQLTEDDFFKYMRVRENIRIAKEYKQPWPWTHDTVLQTYRFCNVFREDDKTTRWCKEYIRDRFENHTNLIWAIGLFRWFNRIETGQQLIRQGFDFSWRNWSPKTMHYMLEDVKPVVTGSYIIKTPDGKNKLDGVIWCLDQFWGEVPRLAGELHEMAKRQEYPTLEWCWNELMRSPYLGNFMAYEIVTDLRHTSVLENATDIMTWANPGPGAMRGIQRLQNKPIQGRAFRRNFYVQYMRELLEAAPRYLPENFPVLEMRDIEHTLCEFDKYIRAVNGEGRPRQKYQLDQGALHRV